MYICSLSLSFNVPSFRAFFESLDVKKNKAAALFASGSRRGGGASRRRYNLERVLFKGCVVSHFDDTLIKMTSLFFPIKFFSSFSTTIVLEAFYASFRFLSWGKKVGRKNSNFFFYPHFSTKKKNTGSENTTRQHYSCRRRRRALPNAWKRSKGPPSLGERRKVKG